MAKLHQYKVHDKLEIDDIWRSIQKGKPDKSIEQILFGETVTLTPKGPLTVLDWRTGTLIFSPTQANTVFRYDRSDRQGELTNTRKHKSGFYTLANGKKRSNGSLFIEANVTNDDRIALEKVQTNDNRSKMDIKYPSSLVVGIEGDGNGLCKIDSLSEKPIIRAPEDLRKYSSQITLDAEDMAGIHAGTKVEFYLYFEGKFGVMSLRSYKIVSDASGDEFLRIPIVVGVQPDGTTYLETDQ